MSFSLKPITELIFYIINNQKKCLSKDYLLDKAMRKTRLNDWGDLEFHEPLEILLTSLRNEARLSQQGKFIITQHYLRLLTNILKIVEDWKQHPEIANVQINPPIFILGFPRTGTTFLHSLMSLDASHRSLRYWELLFPSPPPEPSMQDSDPRIKMAQWFVYFIDKISPKLADIHQLKATGVEECCFIFDHFFLDNIHNMVFDVPSYIQWYDKHDPVPSYKFHYRMLQHYGWKYSFERYVLKAPRHLFCLKALLEVYPDAHIIWTHREPKTAIASLCSLSETARRIVSHDVDNKRIGRLCLDYFEKDFNSAYPARNDAKPGQILDVPYRDLVHDPIKTVQKIYQHFGFLYTDQLDNELSRKIQQKPTGNRKPHQYSLEDYDINPAEIDERLKSYSDAFGD